MKLAIIVLNKLECLDDILLKFCDAGIKGATILDSVGMAHQLEADDELKFWGSLRSLLDPSHKESKTILVMTEDEKIQTIADILNEVTGGLSHPDTGIMCTVNIEGIIK